MFRRRTGFTLIELLVVVAIIALLISILMPALSKAKDLAKDLTCRMNLKHIGQAFMIYINDNAEMHPPGGWPLSWDWNTCNSYDQILLPYIKADFWYCTKDPDTPANGPTWWRRSYGYNNSFMYYTDNSSRPADDPSGSGMYYKNSVPANKVERPAATILIGDRNLACLVGIWQGGDLGASAYDGDPTHFESQASTKRRHHGRINYLFDDSHVEAINPQLTIPPRLNLWSLKK